MGWFSEEDGYQRLLETIAHYFGLGQVLAVQRVGGHANKNYIVTTPGGEFVLKILLNHVRADLEQEQRYLKRLAEHAFPAAYYLQSPHGTFYYQDEHTLAVALHKKDGIVPEPSEAVCRELGAQLARLHQIPTDALPAKLSWMQPAYLPESLAVAKQHLEPQEVEPFLQAYANVCHFRSVDLPQSIIHADVVPPNCLFMGTRLVALIDWEEVTRGASMLDLAMSTLLFCFVKRRFQANLFAQLLAGYTTIRPLTKEETAQLEVAVRYVGLTLSTYFLLQFTLYHPDDNLKAMRTFYWDYQLDTWTIR